MLSVMTPLGTILSIIRVAGLIPLIVKIVFYTKYEPKQLILYVIYAFLGIIVYFKSGLQIPIALLIFWIAIDEIPYKSIVSIYFFAGMFVGLLTIVLCILGLLPNRPIENKLALGFIHWNNPGMLSIMVMLSYMMMRDKKLRLWELAVAFLISCLINKYTKCDGAWIASLVVLIIGAAIVIKRDGVIGNVICWFSEISFPLFFVINFIIQKLYGKVGFITNNLNEYLTGRLYLADTSLKEYGISLLGQKTNWSHLITNAAYKEGEQEIIHLVDSLYIRMMIEYGILFLLVLMILFFLLGKRCKKYKVVYMSLTVFVMALYGIVESNAISIVYNPTLIAIGYLVLKNRNKLMFEDALV